MTANCPVCSNPLSPKKPWLSRCRSCGFYFSNLRPGAGTGIGGLETLRRENFERLLDIVEKYHPLKNARLLEVGCAEGWFLEAAVKRGLVVSAVEPEDANARLARKKGFDIRSGFFPDAIASEKRFDLIVFNDVFEHLPDPVAGAKAIDRALKPGGLAILNLPSSNGAIFRIASLMDCVGLSGPFERLWQKGLPSPHISYFNPNTLDRLVTINTPLEPVGRATLASMGRKGLNDRVKSTVPGFKGTLLVSAAWLLSFVINWLPADIIVGLYRKPVEPAPDPEKGAE